MRRAGGERARRAAARYTGPMDERSPLPQALDLRRGVVARGEAEALLELQTQGVGDKRWLHRPRAESRLAREPFQFFELVGLRGEDAL